jgi:hypothetical protein
MLRGSNAVSEQKLAQEPRCKSGIYQLPGVNNSVDSKYTSSTFPDQRTMMYDKAYLTTTPGIYCGALAENHPTFLAMSQLS